MKLIRNLIKKASLTQNNDVKALEIHSIMSQLAHDLTNNFATMRLITKTIQENLIPAENSIFEDKLITINKILDNAKINVEMVRLLTLPETEKPSDVENFSILDCLHKAINSYPYPAKKYLSCFQVATETDYSVTGNQHLMLYAFYLLIKYAIKHVDIEKNNILITFKKSGYKNYMHFQIPYSLPDKNIFSLGVPTDHGHGFLFIKSAIKGDVIFNMVSEKTFVITFEFPCVTIL